MRIKSFLVIILLVTSFQVKPYVSSDSHYEVTSENNYRRDLIPLNSTSGKIYDVLYDNRTDSLWFTINNASELYNLDLKSKVVYSYPTGRSDITPSQIIFDDNMDIWFTDYDFAIDKVEYDYFGKFNVSSKEFEFYKIPTLNSAPIDIEYAFGYIWVSEWLGDKFIRFDPLSSELIEKKLECNTVTCAPLGIAYDKDVIYLLETGRASILKYDPSDFTELDPIEIPEDMPGPVDIYVDNELMWLGIHGGDQLAWYNMTSKTFESVYTVPPDSGYPISGINEIRKTDDDLIWFSEHFVNWMGVYDPSTETITEFRVGREIPSNTQWIDTDGERVWFAEYDNEIISEFNSSAIPKFRIKVDEINIDQGKSSIINFDVSTSDLLSNNQFQSFVEPIFTYGIEQSKGFQVILNNNTTKVSVGIDIDTSVRPGEYSVIVGIQNEEIIVSMNIKISVNTSFTALYYLSGVFAIIAIIIIIVYLRGKNYTNSG